MKKVLVCLLLLVAGQQADASHLVCHPAQSDTIHVSHTTTTYLIFPAEVDLLDIGLLEGYYAKIEGKSVFIRAKNASAAPTNFLIKYGEAYFTGILDYRVVPIQFLYDFRKEERNTAHTANASATEKAEVQLLENRLGQLATSKPNAVLRSKTRDKIRFFLSAIRVDKGATYLKLGIHNGSSMDFTIDFTGFELIENKGKRFSANNRNRKLISPLMSLGEANVEAEKKTFLLFAIPTYAMRSKSKLRITVKEASGARVLSLAIPARLLAKAKRVDQP